MSESKKDPTILVGIDIGTTASGVSYRPSWAKDTEISKIITTWDESNGDIEKVDSAICFGKSSSQQNTWGFPASLEDNPIRWFKLALIDEEDLPREVRESGQKNWTIRQPYDSISTKVKRAAGGQPKVIVTSEDAREVFAPTMEKILKLVLGQVTAVEEKSGRTPKFIIQVGGFGRNAWLHQCLKNGSRGIEVLQSSGAGPCTAICRGAVIHAMQLEKLGGNLNVRVLSRIARVSISVRFTESWDPKRHELRDKFWDDIREKWRAGNQMRWFISPVSHSFTDLYSSTPGSIKISIYMSRSTPTPTRKDATVSKFCSITWETNVDVGSLPPWSAPSGKILSRMDYTVVMACIGGTGADVDVIHAGHKQASKNIDVEFRDYGGIADNPRK